MRQFCSTDHLTKDNKYNCPQCNSKQNATKKLSINHAPRILVCVIKRFDIFGRKINKVMKYPRSFNLKSLMDTANDIQLMKQQISKGQAVAAKVPKLRALPD